MENIDLKRMWQNANIQNNENISKEADIGEIIRMNHSKNTAKVLFDIKLKILLYSGFLTIFIGLMLYAIVYLGINFSINSIIPFTLVGLFLLISTTIKITRFFAFKGNEDNLPLKESQKYFCKKLNRMKTIDFLSYLILLYLSAILIIRGYIRDIGGFQNLSATNAMQFFILFLILMLLLTPWFIKYQNNQRYRKMDSDLNDSLSELND